jgi:NDP-sugar pyrophosphorylase family protein
VLYGDSYLRVDLAAVAATFRDSDAEALMTVYRNEGRWDESNADFDGRRVVRYEKHVTDPDRRGMHHIDYGLSVLQADSVRRRVPANGASDLADLFGTLSREGRLAGYEAQHRFYEIGSPAGLEDLRRHLAATP